jgi:hypothetical protein
MFTSFALADANNCTTDKLTAQLVARHTGTCLYDDATFSGLHRSMLPASGGMQ